MAPATSSIVSTPCRRDGVGSGFVPQRRCASAVSVSDFLGRECGDGVDFGLGEADARGGEVLMEGLDAGGGGGRGRRGGGGKLPGERDLLRRDVGFGGERGGHRVRRGALGGGGGGHPGERGGLGGGGGGGGGAGGRRRCRSPRRPCGPPLRAVRRRCSGR